MTLACLTSYSQYPITKKIGNDSVVIMTVPQGEYINKLYKQYNNTIDSLKSVDSAKAANLAVKTVDIKDKTRRYDSLVFIHNKTVQLFKKQSDDVNRESEKETALDKIFNYVLAVTVMVFIKDIMY